MSTADWILLVAIILVGIGLVWVEIRLSRMTEALKDDEYPDDHMPGRPT